MRTRTGLHLSALTLAALAAASGCADDASDRGESGPLATIDDPAGAEAGDAGSIDGELLDGSTAPTRDGGEATDGRDVATLDGGLDAGGGSVAVRDPDDSYFGSITANGTGCPPGTWKTEVGADGSFKLVFSAYEVNINDRVPDLTITRNCTLVVQTHSPMPLSYAVTGFTMGGYAYLEEGVTGSVWARYYVQGNPVPPTNTNRIELMGPFDSDFVLRDDVKTADTVWSPCNRDRALIINTTLQLHNSTPKRAGYMNIAELPTPGAIEVTSRPCGNTPTPPIDARHR